MSEHRPPITTADVGKILDVTPDRVRQLERSGVLKAERTASGVRLFDAVQVARVAAAREEKRRGGAS